jgi:hypothetical protein
MEANLFTEVTGLHCHLRSSQIRAEEKNERLKMSVFYKNGALRKRQVFLCFCGCCRIRGIESVGNHR